MSGRVLGAEEGGNRQSTGLWAVEGIDGKDHDTPRYVGHGSGGSHRRPGGKGPTPRTNTLYWGKTYKLG